MKIEWKYGGQKMWTGHALDGLLCFTVEAVRYGKWSAVVDGKERQGIANPDGVFYASDRAAMSACEQRLRDIVGGLS